MAIILYFLSGLGNRIFAHTTLGTIQIISESLRDTWNGYVGPERPWHRQIHSKLKKFSTFSKCKQIHLDSKVIGGSEHFLSYVPLNKSLNCSMVTKLP